MIELSLFAQVILLHLNTLLVLIFFYQRSFLVGEADWVFYCWFSYTHTHFTSTSPDIGWVNMVLGASKPDMILLIYIYIYIYRNLLVL